MTTTIQGGTMTKPIVQITEPITIKLRHGNSNELSKFSLFPSEFDPHSEPIEDTRLLTAVRKVVANYPHHSSPKLTFLGDPNSTKPALISALENVLESEKDTLSKHEIIQSILLNAIQSELQLNAKVLSDFGILKDGKFTPLVTEKISNHTENKELRHTKKI